MNIFDRIFAIGGVFLCIGLTPALFGGVHAPLWTSIVTTSVLTVFTVTYWCMKYRLAAATVGVQVIFWTAILIEGIH